ncbi:MAG: hypothetical protein KJ604_20470 [Gammaproteobacteria bacterium]|nr:hypothetical protein [Gammaproteobacteria bacterium]
MNEIQLFTTGRRGCVACIDITIYPNSIIAFAELAKLTPAMMSKALKRRFPSHTFYTPAQGNRQYIRTDADRWTGDGVEVAE